MKLITVEVVFAEDDLEVAMELFAKQAATVRTMAGCKYYALYSKPERDGVAILQQWDTMDAFETYRTSDVFAQLGKGLRPLMTAPPVTTVAEVTII